MKSSAVTFIYMDATVNVNSYEKNPTSLFMNENLFIPLEPSQEKKVDFFIKPM